MTQVPWDTADVKASYPFRRDAKTGLTSAVPPYDVPSASGVAPKAVRLGDALAQTPEGRDALAKVEAARKRQAAMVLDNGQVPLAASGMIFLRHSEQGWLARFFGVKGVSGQSELPLPCPCDAELADVLVAIKGKFGACWLLIAP